MRNTMRATISSRDEQLEHFTALGVAVSRMCCDPLLQYGPKALEDHRKGLCTYDVEQVVLGDRCDHRDRVHLLNKGLHAGLQQRSRPRDILCYDFLSGH